LRVLYLFDNDETRTFLTQPLRRHMILHNDIRDLRA
jgi:hypothetical protein